MSNHEIFSSSKPPPSTSPTMMPINVDHLTIEDLKMLLCIQCKKAAREAEAKRLAEEAEREAEWVAAAAAAQKAEEKAKEKAWRVKKAVAVKKQKAVEVVGSGTDAEPSPLQKKGKGKVRAESMESIEELGNACQR
jgi:broad specificity polyphosphatase/5'/3'-nucleotidase SurE